MIDHNKKWLNYFPKKDITCIYEDSKKSIWVGTKDDGLFRLDRNGGITNYGTAPHQNMLSSSYVRCVVEDNLGNYWIGTFKGLDKLDVTTGTFTHYSKDNKPYSLSNSLYDERQAGYFLDRYVLWWGKSV
jgi:ligand-binding sensor domain-containing protein